MLGPYSWMRLLGSQRTVPKTRARPAYGRPRGGEVGCIHRQHTQPLLSPPQPLPRLPHKLHGLMAASPSPGVRLIGNRVWWETIYENPSLQTRNICPRHSTTSPTQPSLALRGPPCPAWGTQEPSGGASNLGGVFRLPAWTPEFPGLPVSLC